jgi:hypothetical protein
VVPFFLLALMSRGRCWPDRLARLIGSSLLIGIVVVIGMLPLWPGWQTWALVQGADSAGRSILALLILSVKDLIGMEIAFPASRLFLMGVFALIYVYCLWRMIDVMRRDSSNRRQAIETQTIASSFLTLFWLLLLVMPLFHAWYIVWSFPLAVLLLPKRRALIASIVFTMSALLVVPYFETVRVWDLYRLAWRPKYGKTGSAPIRIKLIFRATGEQELVSVWGSFAGIEAGPLGDAPLNGVDHVRQGRFQVQGTP